MSLGLLDHGGHATRAIFGTEGKRDRGDLAALTEANRP